MQTFALSGGDLVLRAGRFATVSGHQKISQDLRCALLEPVGNDRFHPAFGSLIDSYIGGLLDSDTEFLVRQEVARVVNNYVAVQQDRIARDGQQGVKSRFAAAEIVAAVTDIKLTPLDDSLSVLVSLQTLENQTVTLSTSVSV